jgi:aspartyl aminopeptidase
MCTRLNVAVLALPDLLAYLDASPSPWHASAAAAARLRAAGFTEVAETDVWSEPPVAGFVRRGGALAAWRRPPGPPSEVRIVGAHTDSPGLRIHPHPDQHVANWSLLGVEVYGAALLNSWLDRDLGVAGLAVAADGTTVLVDVAEPLARVPQLAIHLDRDVNERGLVLDRHVALRPVWAVDDPRPFGDWLAARAGRDDLVAWDLALYDVQPASILGADGTLLASGRLDNQVSCWAAIAALMASPPGDHLAVAALFDHEEVGSASTSGASGPFLEAVLARLTAAGGVTGDDRHRLFARSSCISADNAHAVHPNYPERHDAGHAPLVNHGPAIKLNANQRYATDAITAARFERCCREAAVPVQRFVSRNNVPCGSTIGPLTATRLGIATVDVGVPQLAMHSARELCGAADPSFLADALVAYWS